MNDTIYALSTPPGNGVAVIRISGPSAEMTLEKCFTKKGGYESNMLYFGSVFDFETGNAVDEAMAVLMRAPRSYTGEDCAELHCHGSSIVLSMVLEILSKLGLRHAEPGEFTRRAFENGRMDMSQAEAVMDLIHSQAEMSAKSALGQLKGKLAQHVAALQDTLTDLIAEIEAAIDYPEEDWEDEIVVGVKPRLSEIIDDLALISSGARQGQIIREGLSVTFVGRPNVGKSSLMNALLGRDRAIVTDIPGTTRDVIEENLNIKGLLVKLYDTAGIRDSDEVIEKIGVERTKAAMLDSDLLLFVVDASEGLRREDHDILDQIKGAPAICLMNKSDLDSKLSREDLARLEGFQAVKTSKHSDLQPLKDAVYDFFMKLAPEVAPPILVTNRRHLDAVSRSEKAMRSALNALDSGDMDCVCIDLRGAWSYLGEITGLTLEESIIDRIFEKFCLGK